MSKRFFPPIKTAARALRARRTPCIIWLIVHGGLALALGISSLFWGTPRINTNLFDILPAAGGLRAVAPADAVVSERNGRQIIILAAAADFPQAKAAAAELYTSLREQPESGPYFETLTLWADEQFLSSVRQYLYEYRFMLLSQKDRELAEQGRAAAIARDALASVYGAFSFAPLDTLESDPFLLVERNIQQMLASSLMSGGSLSLKDNVLAAHYEGNWYVMLRGSLSPAGTALTTKRSAVPLIYRHIEETAAANPAVRFYCSGVPFHSYASASGAQREISLISSVSGALVLLLFLWAFRSPAPALASFSAAGISILTALASSLLFFREMHILTLVFGTTLIGTCVDYSLHFFVRRMETAGNGVSVRLRIIRGAAMSYVSTAICFLALLAAPFRILKQFSVFSVAGLTSSFLSVMCLFPLLARGAPANRTGRHRLRLSSLRFFSAPLPPALRHSLLAAAVLVCAVLIILNRDKIHIENQLSSLYTMPAPLLESERINARALNLGSAGWYFIIAGDSAQEVLENEEAMRKELDGEIARGNLASYMAASLFVPSIQTQRASYEAAGKLLPLAEAQFEALGFPPGTAEAYRRQYAENGRRYLLPESAALPRSITGNLWIGQTGSRWYSAVIPLHAKDEAPFRAIAQTHANVFFINKARDTGAELDRLTRIMLLLLLAALTLIAAAASRLHSWKLTLRILAVPLFLALIVLAVLCSLNIPLGFFSVVGLLLGAGLGLDYLFYSAESERRPGGNAASHTRISIFLSFITSALSFGALAISSFVPVHVFGVTVCAALCAAYISALLLSGGASGGSKP
jgi:predicted exporter